MDGHHRIALSAGLSICKSCHITSLNPEHMPESAFLAPCDWTPTASMMSQGGKVCRWLMVLNVMPAAFLAVCVISLLNPMTAAKHLQCPQRAYPHSMMGMGTRWSATNQ